MMLEGENKAEVEKAETAEIARKEGKQKLLFSLRERLLMRHRAGLNGFLKRLENSNKGIWVF